MTTVDAAGARGVARRRAPLVAAGLTAGLTAVLAATGDLQVGEQPSFLPAWLTLVLALDVLTAALLVDQYRLAGGTRLLVLSCAYVWSSVLIVGSALALPGVVLVDGAWPGDLNVAWILWTARHVGMPVLIGIALMPWPERRVGAPSSPARRTRRLLAVHAVVASAAASLPVLASTAPGLLPDISELRADGSAGPTPAVVVSVLVVVGATVALALLGVLRRRQHQGLEAWAVVAGVAICGDVILVIATEARWTVAWYGARTLGLVSAVVVLLAMLRWISRLHQQVVADAALVEEQNRALLQAQGLRDHLAAVVSHDMRSPLTGLQGYLELLRDDRDGLDPAAVQRMLDRSWLLTRRLTLLTEDLLAVATVDHGGLQLLPEDVDVADQAVECLAGFPTLPAVLDCPVGLTVHADPLRLQQVLTNLVRNAQTHGEAPVTLSARPGGPGQVEIRVADAGPGVPPAFVPHLFERYSRAGSEVRGSGLGLSVVHDLVTAHGGSVGYDPADGAFVITLPSGSPAAPQPPEPRGAPADLVVARVR